MTELKQRGVEDVLVCCVDGLTGFPEAIEAVYPNTWIQTCLVHAVRAALRFVPYKDKRALPPTSSASTLPWTATTPSNSSSVSLRPGTPNIR